MTRPDPALVPLKNFLKALTMRTDVDQASMACHISMSTPTMNRVANGKRDMHASELLKILLGHLNAEELAEAFSILGHELNVVGVVLPSDDANGNLIVQAASITTNAAGIMQEVVDMQADGVEEDAELARIEDALEGTYRNVGLALAEVRQRRNAGPRVVTA